MFGFGSRGSLPEQTVSSQLSRLTFFAGLFLLLCFIVFIINQTAQVVSLANTVSPVFGRIVLIFLLASFSLILLVPLLIVARMPQAIRPPIDSQSPDYQVYLRKLCVRLNENPHLAGMSVQEGDRTGIEAALKVLNSQVDTIIKKTASNIFVSTAISQNGMLDSLMVLAAQTRMIWQIARVYRQRASIREMVQLYANVGATVFIAGEIEALDLSEQIEPVINTMMSGSVVSLVPGIKSIASIVTQSILDGTANAFLTLRVGVVCRTYCSSLVAFDRQSTRRFASVTAAGMLGSIVSASASRVAKAILGAAKKAGVSTIESTAAGIRDTGVRLNPFKSRE
jgi:hypothetical protein